MELVESETCIFSFLMEHLKSEKRLRIFIDRKGTPGNWNIFVNFIIIQMEHLKSETKSFSIFNSFKSKNKG